MKQEKHIKVVNNRDVVIDSTIAYEYVGPKWKLSFSCPQCVTIEVLGDDVFDCLVHIRKALEKENIQMLCNAARKDVYPSTMSRQMSGGTKAYVMKLGKPASQEDLVNVFDDAEIEAVGSVKDQYDFYKKWRRSLIFRFWWK